MNRLLAKISRDEKRHRPFLVDALLPSLTAYIIAHILWLFAAPSGSMWLLVALCVPTFLVSMLIDYEVKSKN